MRWYWMAVLGILLCGCGPSINRVPASGVITLDGEPLAGVDISTQPVGTKGSSVYHPGSHAKTDAEGRFTLLLQTDDQPGAVVGTHAVYISFGHNPTQQDPNSNHPKLKQEYWDGTLRFTVPEGGTDQLKFELEAITN